MSSPAAHLFWLVLLIGTSGAVDWCCHVYAPRRRK